MQITEKGLQIYREISQRGEWGGGDANPQKILILGPSYEV